MRNNRYVSLLLFALVLFGSAFAQATEGPAEADIVFTNGVIFTADREGTIASALAVKDGRILLVGDDEDALAFAGANTLLRDLDGQFMMPGLIDAHIHSVLPSFFDIDVTACTAIDDLIEVASAYVDGHPEQASYFGFGYQVSMFEGIEKEKGPRKERLDEICPDKPLAIIAYAGHELWVNSKFLEQQGITAETPSPQGGTIVKDDESGEPWGTLKDGAMRLDANIFSQDKLMQELPNLVSLFNHYGYTSFLSVSALDILPVPFEAYRQLEEEGLLTIKMHGTASLSQAHYEEDIEKGITARETYASDLIKVNTFKVFIDGAVDTRTAFLLEPYEGTADSYGQAAWDQEVLNLAFAQANENGLQIHAHAIGDGAVRMALDALEYAKAAAPEEDCRNVLTHLQLVSEADKPRFGALGVSAVTQPFWQYRVYGFTDEAEGTAVGEERVQHFYPMKSLADGGALIAASSDFPFTADPNPFIGMQVGITRNLPDGAEDQHWYNLPSITDMDDPAQLLAPEERVTIEDMIRAYTINAAYTLFADDETGSLEAGKAADLVIVDQNLLEVDPLLISHTQVLQTYLNGSLVYEAK
ncbi:amidohydrolase [Eubacteriales bacterium OttesenSCG-928-A19]|nr:amidohydrolase [Eubacteriales bacterium OttesenSCG-928-A19]